MKENIQKLLGLDVPSNYIISKELGIAQSTLSDYARGVSDIGNMKLDHAIKLNEYYKEMEKMTNQVWTRENYTVEMVDFDGDLKQFEVTQGDKVQIITPDSIESMGQIITDLSDGEDVDGWEDGNGNEIVIE